MSNVVNAYFQDSPLGASPNIESQDQLLTFYLDKQLFGIPVAYIKDIFKCPKITQVPLTPPEIAGVVNLRGHIVTAINLRHKLGLDPLPQTTGPTMNIAVDVGKEMYSFIVDRVSEVMMFDRKDYEDNPSTLDDNLKDLSLGIYKMAGQLLIVLDVKKLIAAPDKN